MKTILFAATALCFGSTALAQTADSSTATQATTSPTTTTGTTVAPGNSAPERDARGIPVVSDPATAPAGVNVPVVAGPNVQLVAPSSPQTIASQPSTEAYPVCSRTVTDNCVQSYERGRRR